MAPEGMVHALEIVQGLLKPSGYLVDIHPSGQPPRIELVRNGQRTLVGHLQESDDFIEYGQAQAALEQALRLGWFSLERGGEFQFVTWSPSIGELRSFLEENWSDAILDPVIDRGVDKLMKPNPETYSEEVTSIEMTEIVRISCYKRKD
jgi:hypothetical protein